MSFHLPHLTPKDPSDSESLELTGTIIRLKVGLKREKESNSQCILFQKQQQQLTNSVKLNPEDYERWVSQGSLCLYLITENSLSQPISWFSLNNKQTKTKTKRGPYTRFVVFDRGTTGNAGWSLIYPEKPENV